MFSKPRGRKSSSSAEGKGSELEGKEIKGSIHNNGGERERGVL